MTSSAQEIRRLRCIAHVDLDCFYCQVEVRHNPSLKGKPVGVVQYNPWESGGVVSHGPSDNRIDNSSNGSLIAVSYEARSQGVKRNMRGGEARRLCPDLTLVQVPTAHGKSDMQAYRDAGEEVACVIGEGADALEKASVDEAYVDLTGAASRLLAATNFSVILERAAATHVAGHTSGEEAVATCSADDSSSPMQQQLSRREVREGHAGHDSITQAPTPILGQSWFSRPAEAWDDHDRLLAAGCALMVGLREAVTKRTGFTCSAGLAHGKLMAKLCSGMHKPNQQTMLPRHAVPSLMATLPLDRVRGLGGKLGSRMTSLGMKTVGDMSAVGEAWLQKRFGDKVGQWLHRVSQGLDDEQVKDRRASMSVSSGKTYDSRQTLSSLPAVRTALRNLLGEVDTRLTAERTNKGRAPKTLTVAIGAEGETNTTGHVSRSCPYRPGLEAMCSDLFSLVRAWASGRGATPLRIHGLFVSAQNFGDLPSRGCTLLTPFLVRQGSSPASGQRPAAPSAASDGLQPSASPCPSPYPPQGTLPQSPLLAGKGSRDLGLYLLPRRPEGKVPVSSARLAPQPVAQDPWSPGAPRQSTPTGFKHRTVDASEAVAAIGRGDDTFHTLDPSDGFIGLKNTADNDGPIRQECLLDRLESPTPEVESGRFMSSATQPWPATEELDLRNIDESVLRQLPPEIQLEVRLAAVRYRSASSSATPAATGSRKRSRVAASRERGDQAAKPQKHVATGGIKKFFMQR